jgi:hypothetical protein
MIEQRVDSYKTQRLIEKTPESLDTLVTLLGLSIDDIENFLEDFDEMLAVEE